MIMEVVVGGVLLDLLADEDEKRQGFSAEL